MPSKRSQTPTSMLSDDERRDLLLAEEEQRHRDTLAQLQRESIGLSEDESFEDLVARELAGNVDPKSKEFRGIRLTPPPSRPRRR